MSKIDWTKPLQCEFFGRARSVARLSEDMGFSIQFGDSSNWLYRPDGSYAGSSHCPQKFQLRNVERPALTGFIGVYGSNEDPAITTADYAGDAAVAYEVDDETFPTAGDRG